MVSRCEEGEVRKVWMEERMDEKGVFWGRMPCCAMRVDDLSFMARRTSMTRMPLRSWVRRGVVVT